MVVMLVFGIQSGASGGSFRSGFMSGIVSSGVSALVGSVASSLHFNTSQTAASMIFAGGLSGGISSRMSGGNFLDGVKQGLMTSSLNHAMHMAGEGIAGALEDPPHSCRYEGQYHEDETGTYYNDGEKWVRVEMQLNTASITAEGTSLGIVGWSLGIGSTGALGVGPQSNLDLVWLVQGQDASVIPYLVVSGGAGAGYNIDIDVHTGPIFYSGYRSDLTASNILNTALDGNGYSGSFDASLVFKGGLYFSTAKASANTYLFGGGVSFGASITPGFNWFGSHYVSKKF